MTSYEELDVWQKAVSLAIEIYRATEPFPRAEKFGLTGQIRRAITSIPANIAEGWGRGSTKEYVQFLLVARGSLLELENTLDHCSKAELSEGRAAPGFADRNPADREDA